MRALSTEEALRGMPVVEAVGRSANLRPATPIRATAGVVKRIRTQLIKEMSKRSFAEAARGRG